MKNLTKIVATMGMLSTAGCASKPFTQAQVAYAREIEPLGTPQLCGRLRHGGKTAWDGEFRLGADVCYHKLPPITSKKEYLITLPYNPLYGSPSRTITVQGTTAQGELKISLPIDYNFGSIGANLPLALPSWLRPSGVHDLSLSLLGTVGFNLDIIAKSTDYQTMGSMYGTIENIPSLKLRGQFFGEATSELLVLGRIPVGVSFRIDDDGRYTPFFSGGYRIQW